VKVCKTNPEKGDMKVENIQFREAQTSEHIYKEDSTRKETRTFTDYTMAKA